MHSVADTTMQLKHVSASESQRNDSALPARDLWTGGYGLYH